MAMCTEPGFMDIPVPDFAWERYPDTGYVRTYSFGACRWGVDDHWLVPLDVPIHR